MPQVKNSKIVSFPIETIYKTVIDIEGYPKILSFIQDLKILEKSENELKARVSVGLPFFQFSYDCKVTFLENEFVKIDMISGPFKKLHAEWVFERTTDINKTKINYYLDSEFKNPLIEAASGVIFASQLNHSIKAFEEAIGEQIKSKCS